MQVLNKLLCKIGTGNCVEGLVNGRTGNGQPNQHHVKSHIIHLKLSHGISISSEPDQVRWLKL